MSNQLFMLDPMAASSYGLYNAYKEGEGSFEDFLLNYDSKGANDGDNAWLSDMLGEDLLSNIVSKESLGALNKYNISTLDLFSSMSYFDTQVQAYKLQLMQEMQKRDIPIPPEAKIKSQLDF